jgi:hypothetical protein
LPVTHLAATNYDERLSDEVELYQRTYMTLLRSSGETRLRVLESSHKAMGSSLHGLADSDQIDLGAFIYAVRRLPDAIAGASIVVMGNELEDLVDAGLPVGDWAAAEAPARRRQWFDGGEGVLGVLIASVSDVDDLIPTLVAYQIEWNKLTLRQRALGNANALETVEDCAAQLGGEAEDWGRLAAAWGAAFWERLALARERKLRLRVRMLGASNVGYGRLTRRWWTPVESTLVHEGLTDQPLYFVSSNTHSLVNIATGMARESEDELVQYVEGLPADDILVSELKRFRLGESRGSWENFLYFAARGYMHGHPAERRRGAGAPGVTRHRAAGAGADHPAALAVSHGPGPPAGGGVLRGAGAL